MSDRKRNSDTETRRLERELATGDLSVVERLAQAYARDGRIRDPRAFVFFFENYGGDIARKIEGSLDLARAEEAARRIGLSFHWTEDPDGCTGCNCSSKDCKCLSGEAHETLQCVVRGAEDEDDDPDKGAAVLASLGGVCEPDRDFRRVVEAELASEALEEPAQNPRRNVDEVCYVCGAPALAGVTTDKGPACKKHLLGHMDVPVGEGEEESACRSCRRLIRRPEDRAYVEGPGFFHVDCLKNEVKRLGVCPKCGNRLDHGDCLSCWNGISGWIEQAKKDAVSVEGGRSEGKRLCTLCLKHNTLIGPGYPFYPIERPQPGDQTCSKCFSAVCDTHAIMLPKGNVLGISPNDVICGALPYRGEGFTCAGKLEEKIKCSVEGCDAFDKRNSKDDPFLTSKQCEKCEAWFCGVDHTPDECPDCVGVRCDRCRKLFDKESLHPFGEDAYTILDLCEDCLSEQETEEQDASWGNWLGSDYTRGLEARFSAEGLDLSLDKSDELEALFDAVRREANIDWSGTEIDWQAVVQCTPVDRIMALPGVELEGSLFTPQTVFPRKVVMALRRVDELTADSEWDGRRNARIVEGRLAARRASRGSSPDTRRGRAAAREEMRRYMRTGGWGEDPERRKAIKALPRTVGGMRTLIDAVGMGRGRHGMEPHPRDVKRRGEMFRAAKKERNEGLPDLS